MPHSGSKPLPVSSSRPARAPSLVLTLCMAVLVVATSASAGGRYLPAEIGIPAEMSAGPTNADSTRALDGGVPEGHPGAPSAPGCSATVGCDPYADTAEGESGIDADGDDQDPAALAGPFHAGPAVVVEDRLRVSSAAGDARPSAARQPQRPPKASRR